MIPIGIMTRNRPAYLDATLRSLSGTILPKDVSVTVFDDASDQPAMRRYLNTNDPVHCDDNWPSDFNWRQKLGLACVRKRGPLVGIKDRVRVERLGDSPQGVVSASGEAVRRLFAAFPAANGVFLLQDDCVFNADWYMRMMWTAEKHRFEQPLGVLAGIKLNHAYPVDSKKLPPVMASGITAQCLYISQAAAKLEVLRVPQTKQKRFDDHLCRQARSMRLWVGVILPFVVQHIGITSLVRPGVSWLREGVGRVGRYSRPPYAMQDAVRTFI